MHARYQAQLHRSGRWWAIDVAEIAVFTQSRTLEEAEHAARQAIAVAVGVPQDTFAVDLVFPEAAPVLRPVAEARKRRAAAAAAEAQALADAAHALVEEFGISQIDACHLLGVSQQWMSQLPASPAPVRGTHGGKADSGDPRSRPLTSHHHASTGFGDRPVSGTAMRAGRRRRVPANRPSWAIAEDDA